MRKYALINNLVITEIIETEDDIHNYIVNNEAVIDIEDMSPQPSVGWIMNGNKLQIPSGISDRELFEIELNDKKCIFGYKLSKNAINRIGARNKILNKSGSQVITLLTQLLGVKSLLETGALGTARATCLQLKVLHTEYSDIFDNVISEINSFEQSNGL